MSINFDDVERKAAALGFSLRKGTRAGAGYTVKHDATGETPFGDDFRAALNDVDRFSDEAKAAKTAEKINSFLLRVREGFRSDRSALA